jgi:hypothetical protein
MWGGGGADPFRNYFLFRHFIQQLHGFIDCVCCFAILLKVGIVNFILMHLCNEQKQNVITVVFRVDCVVEETWVVDFPLENGNPHSSLLVVQKCLVYVGFLKTRGTNSVNLCSPTDETMPHQCKMCHPEHLYLFPIGEC